MCIRGLQAGLPRLLRCRRMSSWMSDGWYRGARTTAVAIGERTCPHLVMVVPTKRVVLEGSRSSRVVCKGPGHRSKARQAQVLLVFVLPPSHSRCECLHILRLEPALNANHDMGRYIAEERRVQSCKDNNGQDCKPIQKPPPQNRTSHRTVRIMCTQRSDAPPRVRHRPESCIYTCHGLPPPPHSSPPDRVIPSLANSLTELRRHDPS